ncbi:MAG: 4Fe-4S binding protein [Candidatus Marinimicrobia bacterium]|nr:4Fe-4S binding protein [Candidatus Neomarinimicrobiota bacterium]
MNQFARNLIRKDSWSDMMMGNYAVARAMFETGVRVATTYPGSPVPEIANAILTVPEDHRDLYFQYSTNEKVALEVAFGASINGHLSTVFFKSVGLNVAADSAIQLGLLNLIGGMVIILGDDPGAHSSQNEQDNRHFARQSYIPMFEPATPTEAYQMFKEAVKISRKYQAPVFMRLTTHVCHAKERIRFAEIPEHPSDWTSQFNRHNGPYLPITKDVFPLKKKALGRLEELEKYAEQCHFNKILSNAPTKAGIITSSMPILSLQENLLESGASIDILKLGFSYPWPKGKVLDFLKSHDEVLILEELDRILEQEIKSLAFDENIQCKIYVRKTGDDLMGELLPHRTWKILSDFWPALFPPKRKPEQELIVGKRVPQMCPGCGHRSAFHAIKKALPDGTITVGDIGCHSLGFFKPYFMGEALLSMGHSNGTGAGLSIRNKDRKVLTFIGDSTFFHAGIPGIINAIMNNHNMTLVIMENGTTAMTGHQPHAGTGEIGDKISIQKLLEAIGVKFLSRVDTYKQSELTQHIKDAMEFEGFAVVIASHPCMLKFTRIQRQKPNYKQHHVHIDQNICNKTYECIEKFGCPSFTKHNDGHVAINEDLCIGDGSCIQTCPVTAINHANKEDKK